MQRVVLLMSICLLSFCVVSESAIKQITVTQTSDEPDCNPGDGFCNTGSPCQSGNFNCTLRAAIEEANAGTNDLVVISIQTFTTNVATITLTSALPAFERPIEVRPDFDSGPVVINCGGSAGFVFEAGGSGVSDLIINNCANGVVMMGNGSNVVTRCFIGTDAQGNDGPGNAGHGVLIDNSHYNAVSAVIAGSGGDGIRIVNGSFSNVISSSFIGTIASGLGGSGNSGNGVHIIQSPGNTIVGSPDSPTVISGNGANGVLIEGNDAKRNFVRGCYIGINSEGNAAIPNSQNGVLITDAPSNFVGFAVVSAAREASVISGNGGAGVKLSGSGTFATTFARAFIGTDLTGLVNVGNTGDGVVIENGASGNSLDERLTPGPCIVAFNGGAGVLVSGGTNNEIAGISIHSNTGLGIDLGGGGITSNDPGDSDSGANALQNFPILSSAGPSGFGTLIEGTINSTPNTDFTIDYYSSTTCDGSGNGEGQAWLDLRSITTDANGNADVGILLSTSVTAGKAITATATKFVNGPTSEFSPCVTVGGPAVCNITCPANMTNTVDEGLTGAIVNYTAPVTTGPCGTVTCVPPAGSLFPVGTTTVDCSTVSGPSCSFTVTVVQPDLSPSASLNSTNCVTGPPPSCTATGNLTLRNNGVAFASANFNLTQTCKKLLPTPKCGVAGTLAIQNIDFGDAPEPSISFFLSNDGSFSPDDALLKTITITKWEAALAKGKTVPIKFKIPKGVNPTGKFIIVVLDLGNEYNESDENNNSTSLGPLP